MGTNDEGRPALWDAPDGLAWIASLRTSQNLCFGA